MIQLAWWQDLIAGILILVITIWLLYRIMPETRTITGTELQKTKEGRNLLAGLQEKSGVLSVPLVVKPCKNCEGSGLIIGPTRNHMGMDSNMYLCQDCGGSGLEGGTDYRVEYCGICTENKRVSNGCPACSGTGVVKIRKEIST